jgi:hypothetical protein
MSTRPLAFFNAVVNGNMASNITSAVSIVDQLSMMSYSYSWSGASPVGTISVQVSNDYSEYPNGQVNNPGTWNTLPLSLSGTSVTAIPLSGNTGEGFVDIDELGAYAIRTIYTAGSGTGLLQVDMNAKVA